MSLDFYRAFEERYRGSRELIKKRLRAYSPFTTPLAACYPGAPAIDLGCGRGEWLELMNEAGFDARGVDLDEGMLAACRERQLTVETADALATLRALPDASVALVSAFHLVEHLPFEQVQELVSQAHRVLLPAGLLIMETPNPENLIVGTSNFYLDPSHIKPVPALLLDFLVQFSGFTRDAVVRLQEPEHVDDDSAIGLSAVISGVSPDYAIVAQADGTPNLLVPFDGAFGARYGVSLEAMAQRYDQARAREFALIDGVRRAQPGNEAALAQIQTALAGLDRQSGILGAAIAGTDASLAAGLAAVDCQARAQDRALSALDRQAQEQGQALAGVDASLRHIAAQADERLALLELAAQRLAPLTDQVESLLLLTQRVETLERSSGLLHEQTLPLHQQLLNATVESVRVLQERSGQQHSDFQRYAAQLSAIDRRTTISERHDAIVAEPVDQLEERLRKAMAETLAARQQAAETELAAQFQSQQAQAAQLLAQQLQAQIAQLDQQMQAILNSTSWRLTAPARLLGGWAKRLIRAARERRLSAAARRRLKAILAPWQSERGGWLGQMTRRFRHNKPVRRVVLPVLTRFPRVYESLSQMTMQLNHVPSAPPTTDISHSDWPGPLPAAYLDLPASARKVLLDLARASQPLPPP